MTDVHSWSDASELLTSALRLTTPPIAITFSSTVPDGVAPFDAPMPDPAPDGRTGKVPAGCVFWVEALERTFTTMPADHGNCSVGSLTHGLATLEDVAGRDDVACLLESGWVTEAMFPRIPVVRERPAAITYGPLSETPLEPDVVMIRIDARQLMVLYEAVPGLRIDGKPQCHIVALAKEGEVAVSVGCVLSRTRTGMSRSEMTCAVPARRLKEVLEKLESTTAADAGAAAYAARDARRFAG
jgi:uncharacterized protein (DUF169 family)